MASVSLPKASAAQLVIVPLLNAPVTCRKRTLSASRSLVSPDSASKSRTLSARFFAFLMSRNAAAEFVSPDKTLLNNRHSNCRQCFGRVL